MNHDMPPSEVKAEQPKDGLTQEIIRLAEEESLGEALEKVSIMKRKLSSRNSGFYGLAHSYWMAGAMAYQEGPEFRWSGSTKMHDKMMEIQEQAEPTKKLLDAVSKLEEALQKALKAESRIIGLEASVRALTKKMERAQELNQADVVEDYKIKINGYYDLLKPAWEERDKQQVGCVEVLNQTDLSNYNPDQDPIDFEAARKKASEDVDVYYRELHS